MTLNMKNGSLEKRSAKRFMNEIHNSIDVAKSIRVFKPKPGNF